MGVFICFFDKIKEVILKGGEGPWGMRGPSWGIKSVLRIRWSIIFPPVLNGL